MEEVYFLSSCFLKKWPASKYVTQKLNLALMDCFLTLFLIFFRRFKESLKTFLSLSIREILTIKKLPNEKL